MTISITSQSLSDYDAQLAYKTATAYLRQSGLARYLIDQLEHQPVKLSIEVSADPALADKDVSNNGGACLEPAQQRVAKPAGDRRHRPAQPQPGATEGVPHQPVGADALARARVSAVEQPTRLSRCGCPMAVA